MPAPLPDEVMTEYVWPWVHQMRMRASLNAIVRAGPSLWEGLPERLHPLGFEHAPLRSWREIQNDVKMA